MSAPLIRPALLSLLLVAAPFGVRADSHEHEHEHDDHSEDTHNHEAAHLAELDALRILHAWSRATSRGPVRIFMEIQNRGDAGATLTSATTDLGDAVIVGAPVHAGGDPLELPELVIEADSDFDLAPQTVYIEIAEPARALQQGDVAEVELTFADLGTVDVDVEVESADATQHSHAGHNH
ncbi:copper chaperone PCu(A)C [Tropicimonas sp. IMCC34011]|uniref:copper chaperone PCu(A)C n=1 Tax=Tropicimonas sp. IMCC34011 TaxID=2248759 RepID=UPI0013001EEF|nr:copper chaperone PCu(A)C [Tropicimonas sp. IMCC34011]